MIARLLACGTGKTLPLLRLPQPSHPSHSLSCRGSHLNQSSQARVAVLRLGAGARMASDLPFRTDLDVRCAAPHNVCHSRSHAVQLTNGGLSANGSTQMRIPLLSRYVTSAAIAFHVGPLPHAGLPPTTRLRHGDRSSGPTQEAFHHSAGERKRVMGNQVPYPSALRKRF